MNAKDTAKEFVLITIGIIIIAAAVFFFAQPFHLTLGSVSGLAIILENLLPLPMSAIALILNAVLLLFGFALIGRQFGAKTIYTSLMLPILLGVFERLFPENTSLTGDAFIDMICYLFAVSFGQSILFACNASSGGLDIVAKIMNKFLHIELGKAMSISGMLVALASALCYDAKTVVLSVLGTWFGGMVVDYFIFGMNIKRRVCIISPMVDDIVHYILYELHSGASISHTIGAYSSEVHKEIITIVDKQEYKLLMDYVRKVDPKAFVTVLSVSELRYQPKEH